MRTMNVRMLMRKSYLCAFYNACTRRVTMLMYGIASSPLVKGSSAGNHPIIPVEIARLRESGLEHQRCRGWGDGSRMTRRQFVRQSDSQAWHATTYVSEKSPPAFVLCWHKDGLINRQQFRIVKRVASTIKAPGTLGILGVLLIGCL